MRLFVTLMAYHASAVVWIASGKWHASNLMGEVIKAEFEARDVEVKHSIRRYESSYASVAGLLTGEIDVIPEAWVDIEKANGFYTFVGHTCGGVSRCEETTSCTLPVTSDCAACEQACADSSDCLIYACSNTEVDVALRCQLWNASRFSESSEFDSEPFHFVASVGGKCALKAGFIDFQAFSSGEERIVIPNYIELIDWTTNKALVSAQVKVLVGPPPAWKSAHATSAAIATKYNLTLIVPTTPEDYLFTILEFMKLEDKFAFYSWKPHAVSATYDITAVTLPLNNDVTPPAPFFPLRQRLLTIWRLASPDTVMHMKKIVSLRDLSHDEFTKMLHTVSTLISITLPTTVPAYHNAIANAARVHLCEVTAQIRFCIPKTMWPWEKASALPDNALVLTHECAGFVKCIGDNGEKLFRPEEGYSIDHLHKAMKLIGYRRQEYDVRCYHEADGITGMVAKTGLEMATLAHGCITITAEEHRLASFSTPFYSTWLNILVKRPEIRGTFPDELFLLWEPFDRSTLIMVGVVVCLVFCCVLLFECIHTGNRKPFSAILAFVRKPFSAPKLPDEPSTITISELPWLESPAPSYLFSNCSWGNAVVMTMVDAIDETVNRLQTTHWIHLKSPFARLFMIFNLLLLLVLAEFYTANVAAFLLVHAPLATIRGLEDLRGKKVAAFNARSSFKWLQKHEPLLILMPCENEQECVDFVLNGDVEAFIHDEPSLQYILAGNICSLTLVNGPRFFVHDYGICFPQGSPMRDTISHAVTFLREEGAHAELQSKYFRTKDCNVDGTKSRITTVHLVGVLIPLIVIFSIFAFISRIYSKIRQKFTEIASHQHTPQGTAAKQ